MQDLQDFLVNNTGATSNIRVDGIFKKLGRRIGEPVRNWFKWSTFMFWMDFCNVSAKGMGTIEDLFGFLEDWGSQLKYMIPYQYHTI